VRARHGTRPLCLADRSSVDSASVGSVWLTFGVSTRDGRRRGLAVVRCRIRCPKGLRA
jgi:hypothetical protein